MANINTPRLDPASMAFNTVASYTSYEEAQAGVDRLSDERFPVENIEIVGSDLRLVEKVTGRLTRGRAAAAGQRAVPGSACSSVFWWACSPTGRRG
jgi:heat induced stress protein YflT